jgi:hypothetical protein
MMDPQESVRIKYKSDDGIEGRVTGGSVPRTGETVCLVTEDRERNVYRRKWFDVDDVRWEVYVDSAERKPDVVTVSLSPKEATGEKQSE